MTSSSRDIRLKGTGPNDDGSEYTKLTRSVKRQVRRLVDLQLELAEEQGTYMVVFGLGDGASSGLTPTDSSYGALNILATRVAACATRRIDQYNTLGKNPRMLWLRGSELCKRGRHPQCDPVHFLKDIPGQETTSPDAICVGNGEVRR